jgi:hypothetical protein
MAKMVKSLFFAVLFSVLMFGKVAQAQTINAASCSSTDVQAAFNSIGAATTTVNIPSCPGGVGWSAQVSLKVPSGSTTLSIIGAGNLSTTGGGDQTVIVDNFNSSNPLLAINTSTPSSIVRLAGITFKGGSSGGNPKYDGMIGFSGPSQNVRVDHIHVNLTTYSGGGGGSGLEFQGCISGVTDHAIFDAGAGSVNNLVRLYNGGNCGGDSLGVGDYSWTVATGLGTANFMFIENNVFNYGAGNDCTKGGRYVWRFNTMNATSPAPSVQTHPTGGGQRERGCRAWEIYKNTVTAQTYINTFFWLSSGTGVVWGNTLPSSSSGGGTGFRSMISFHNMRNDNSTYSQSPTPQGWGYCGTAFAGLGSNWDKNSNILTGYPCLDQPGRGAGQRLINDFPNILNQSTGSIAWPNQALEPIYEWSDAYSPVPSNPSSVIASSLNDVENRDYYQGTVDSGSSVSFNGSLLCATAPHCGVGSGALASRPSSCTTGVSYWATDQGNWNSSGSGGQGVLYTCTSSNNWTAFYTPFAYPHPLTHGSTSGTSGTTVAPPSNLSAIIQ